MEVPMEAAMLCRKGTKKHSGLQETEAKSDESNKIPKTKHACIVEVHETKRQRLESSLPKDHEYHIAGRGYNTMAHYNLVHIFYSDASNDEHSGCGSSGQGVEEARNDSGLAVGQS